MVHTRWQHGLVSKWGEWPVEFGFTMIPNLIIRINQFLREKDKMTASEMFVVITIMSYWYSPKNKPFPTVSKISSDTSISERQIKRILSSLKKKGFINVNRASFAKSMSNSYDFTPLKHIIETCAKAKGDKEKQKALRLQFFEPDLSQLNMTLYDLDRD